MVSTSLRAHDILSIGSRLHNLGVVDLASQPMQGAEDEQARDRLNLELSSRLARIIFPGALPTTHLRSSPSQTGCYDCAVAIAPLFDQLPHLNPSPVHTVRVCTKRQSTQWRLATIAGIMGIPLTLTAQLDSG